MKTYYKLLSAVLLGLSLSATMTSCGDDSITEGAASNSGKEPDKVEATIKLGGELTTSVDPISRADDGSNDLYAIAVSDPSGNYDANYAYGVFDKETIEKGVSISLYLGVEYTFEARMIVDGKDKVYYNNTYWFPFNSSVTNAFSYGKNGISLADGTVSLPIPDGNDHDHTEYNYAPVDTYYGFTSYTAEEGGAINIDMQRYTFELAFNITGLDEGNTLAISPNSTLDMPNIEFTSTNTSYDELHSCLNYMHESDTSPINIEFDLSLTDSEGNQLELPSNMKQFTLSDIQRLNKYTINIVVTTVQKGESTATVTYTVEEMAENDYTLDYNGFWQQTSN